jgi:hypothetical protein
MGHYKNLEVAMQDDVTRYHNWYEAVGHTLDAVTWAWLDERSERLWNAIELWENAPYKAVRAIDHVALQPVTRAQALAAERNRKRAVSLSTWDWALAVVGIAFFGLLSLTLFVMVVR